MGRHQESKKEIFFIFIVKINLSPFLVTHLPGPYPSPSDATAFITKAAAAQQLATKLLAVTL